MLKPPETALVPFHGHQLPTINDGETTRVSMRPICATPAASAIAIYQQGNQPNQAARLRFCNRLISFADLDNYPRRQDFITAFSTGGSEEARRVEARAMAQSGLLDATDIAYCAEKAQDTDFDLFGAVPEIC